MKTLLRTLILFSLCSNVFAENWIQYADNGYYVDSDSILVLQKPKRLTYKTKVFTERISGEKYAILHRGISCDTGQFYVSEMNLYDENDNFVRASDNDDLNKKKDIMSNTLEHLLYTNYCLKNKKK